MKNASRALVAFLMVYLAPMIVSQARAEVIAKDLFDTNSGYISGTNLGGQSATDFSLGFTGAWPSGSNFFTIQTAAAVSMSGIFNTGGVVRIRPSSTNSRTLSRTFTASTGNSAVWSSSLFYVQDAAVLTASNGIEAMYGFTSGTLTSSTALWSDSNGNSLSGFQLGVSSSSSLVVKYQSDASGSYSIDTADTSFALSTATSYFVVTELIVNSSGVTDTLNIWVLTYVPTDESAIHALTPTYTIAADILNGSGDLNTLLLTAGATGSTYGTTYVDALMLGTSYSDVISAIPEPSAIVLMVAGLTSCMWIYSTRRKKTFLCSAP